MARIRSKRIEEGSSDAERAPASGASARGTAQLSRGSRVIAELRAETEPQGGGRPWLRRLPRARKRVAICGARCAVGRVGERIHYVLLFAGGETVAQIATIYEVDERTILSWLERYRAAGTAGLDDLSRSGRPRLANEAARAEATRCQDAASAPASSGGAPGLLALAVQYDAFDRRLGLRLDAPQVDRQGPRSRGEEREAAIAAVIAAYPTAPQLYEDECDVAQLPVFRGK